MKIAIVTPQSDGYTETFIRAHRDRLEGRIGFYDGGVPPSRLNGEAMQPGRYSAAQLIFLCKSILSAKPLPPLQHFFQRSLRQTKPDVILAEYGTTGADILPMVIPTGIPMVVIFHGYDASCTGILQEYAARYRRMFGYAKAVMTVSRSMQSTLVELGYPEEKIIYNPYGPDPEFFRNKPRFQNRRFYAAGRFVEKKAPHLTILAFFEAQKVSGDATLVMTGDGPLRKVCEDLAKYLGISEKVTFTGPLAPEMVLKEMQGAFAFVQHSRTAPDGDREGTPVGILEAQAAALPVISTLHAGIPEVVVDEKTGLLSAENDVGAMASNMIRLLGAPNLATEMGAAGRERVSRHFTMEQHIATLQQTLANATAV